MDQPFLVVKNPEIFSLIFGIYTVYIYMYKIITIKIIKIIIIIIIVIINIIIIRLIILIMKSNTIHTYIT